MPDPVRVCFAGAGARAKVVPPGSRCTTEDRVRIGAQLRLESGNRRKTDTEEPNSVEKGAHRRKASAPVRVCFAGVGESVEFIAPVSPCSTEDSI